MECSRCRNKRNIIAPIRDLVVTHRILNPLDIIETFGNDLTRSPTEGGLSYERVYDHFPPSDEILPDS